MFLGKKDILVRAPLLTYSGYGTHSRQIYRYVHTHFPNSSITCGILPWGMTPWMIDTDLCNGEVGRMMASSTVDPNKKFDISFQCQLPNEWDPNLAKFNIGLSAFVETDQCNPQWASACNNMDLIIVPSKHVADVVMSSGTVTTPVKIVNESFYPEVNNDQDTLALDLPTNFNFLCVSQITGHDPEVDRKNLFKTVKWFVEEFDGDKSVGLVIKTNSGTNTTIDKKLTSMIMEKLVGEIRTGDFPKVHMLHGPMTNSQIVSLYKHPKIKALVSLTRGEGFGLPLLEAAACGLPVIATNWSGHLDFLKLGKFLKIPYTLRPINKKRVDNVIFMEGSKWAEVDEASTKKILRKFVEKPAIPIAWAKEMQPKILAKFSESAIFDSYTEAIKDMI